MCHQGEHLGLWHEAESSLDMDPSSPNEIERLSEMHLEVGRRPYKHRAQVLGQRGILLAQRLQFHRVVVQPVCGYELLQITSHFTCTIPAAQSTRRFYVRVGVARPLEEAKVNWHFQTT